jgi:hypothetical protein
VWDIMFTLDHTTLTCAGVNIMVPSLRSPPTNPSPHLIQVDDHPRVLVEGQEEDIWRMSWHPTMRNIFASSCESGKVWILESMEAPNL